MEIYERQITETRKFGNDFENERQGDSHNGKKCIFKGLSEFATHGQNTNLELNLSENSAI